MAFPDNLWIASAFNGNVQKFEKDSIAGPSISVGSNNPQGVLVSQDRVTVYTANKENNKVSVIRSGKYIDSITVGKQPYGMCEDLDNALYVTCYEDNTVYKIDTSDDKNFKIIKSFNVPAGPAGITCDSDGTLWVACSKAGVVAKIVNDLVTLKIPTGDANATPIGIACDRVDGIWVANYSANTVIRIVKSKKMLVLDVQGHPTDIVTDTNNNVYVAGYLNDTITYIPASNPNNTKAIVLPTNSGVSALSLNSDNDIYAVASLSNKIIKIHNLKIVDTIDCPDITPVGFGDFTGCKMYNIINSKASASTAITPSDAAVKLMSSLNLQFNVDDVKESASTVTLKISSNDVNLSIFDHVKMNGNTGIVAATGNATFVLSAAPPITDLKLVGYFDLAEESYVPFAPQNFNDIFKIVVGSMDVDSSGNYTFTEAVKPFKSVNASNEVSNVIIETVADGYMAVLIPERVQADVEKGLLVNGMQIYDDWTVDPSDLPSVQSAISAYPNYVAYINPNMSYSGAVAILNRYKL